MDSLPAAHHPANILRVERQRRKTHSENLRRHRTPPLVIPLNKGRSIRGRVVDGNSKPAVGALVIPSVTVVALTDLVGRVRFLEERTASPWRVSPGEGEAESIEASGSSRKSKPRARHLTCAEWSPDATRRIQPVQEILQKGALIAGLLYWALPPSLNAAATFDQANEQTRVEKPDRATTIHGKTLDAWLVALKDRDPAVRKRAVEVVGERAVDPDLAQDERLRLQTAVRSVLSSDKDAEVRQAAAFFADLFKVSGAPTWSIA